jgi:hypothetical protein
MSRAENHLNKQKPENGLRGAQGMPGKRSFAQSKRKHTKQTGAGDNTRKQARENDGAASCAARNKACDVWCCG